MDILNTILVKKEAMQNQKLREIRLFKNQKMKTQIKQALRQL